MIRKLILGTLAGLAYIGSSLCFTDARGKWWAGDLAVCRDFNYRRNLVSNSVGG